MRGFDGERFAALVFPSLAIEKLVNALDHVHACDLRLPVIRSMFETKLAPRAVLMTGPCHGLPAWLDRGRSVGKSFGVSESHGAKVVANLKIDIDAQGLGGFVQPEIEFFEPGLVGRERGYAVELGFEASWPGLIPHQANPAGVFEGAAAVAGKLNPAAAAAAPAPAAAVAGRSKLDESALRALATLAASSNALTASS